MPESLFWRAPLSPQDLRPALPDKKSLFSRVLIPVLGLLPRVSSVSLTLAPELEGNSLRYQSHGNTVVTSYLTCFLSPPLSHYVRARPGGYHHLHCPVIGKYSQHPDSGELCTLVPCASSCWCCIQMGFFMNTHRPVVSLSSVSPLPLPSKTCS